MAPKPLFPQNAVADKQPISPGKFQPPVTKTTSAEPKKLSLTEQLKIAEYEAKNQLNQSLETLSDKLNKFQKAFQDQMNNQDAKLKAPVGLFGAEPSITPDEVTAEDRLNFKGFSDRDISKIKQLSREIDFSNRSALLQFGNDTTTKLASIVDDILAHVKVNAFGQDLSAQITRLLSTINQDFTKPQEASSFLGVFKKKISTEERINDAIFAVEMISKDLSSKFSKFDSLIPKIDELLENGKKYHNELRIFIAAGQDRVKQFMSKELVKLEAQLETTHVMVAQDARDSIDKFKTFENRIKTLEASIAQNELTLAQIRITQQTNVKTFETLSHMITFLIPEWKKSLIFAVQTNNFASVDANKNLLSQSLNDIIKS